MSTEKTFALIKPDATHNESAGNILRIMERHFDIQVVVGAQWSRAAVESFYAEHKEKHFFPHLVDFMSSGLMYAAILCGPNVIGRWRHMIGPTDPKNAPPHTIRYIFGDHKGPMMRNAVHGSDSEDSARREIQILRQMVMEPMVFHLRDL